MRKKISLFTQLTICLLWSMTSCQVSEPPDTISTSGEAKSISSTTVEEIILLGTFGENQDRILDVAFSPDGEILASSGQDRIIRLWATNSSKEIQNFPMQLVDMADIDISPDGTLLASGESIWDLKNGQELITLERGSPIPAFVAFSPDGSHLAVALMDQGVELWDTSSGDIDQILAVGEEKRTKRMEFSPDGSRLAAGVIDGTIRIWDVDSGEIIQTLHFTGESDIHDLAYSADGRYIATTGRLPRSILWDAINGEVLQTFSMRDNGLGITFSPDSTILAVSAGAERALLLYELPSGDLVRTLDLEEQAMAVSFSPDGRYLAAGTFDGKILLWGLSVNP